MLRMSDVNIATGAGILVLGMLLFPPFDFTWLNGATSNAGYAFILSPPVTGNGLKASVDIGVLVTQWLAVAIATGAMIFRNRSERSASTLNSKPEIATSSNESESRASRGGLSHTDQSNANDPASPAQTRPKLGVRVKLRLFGAVVLLFNLWLVGTHQVGIVASSLATWGFAIAFEMIVVQLLAPEGNVRNASAAHNPEGWHTDKSRD